MSELILVTGGARSGKSTFAELLASSSGQRVTYIATAQVWDEEMAFRVQKHKESRPPEWDLIEEPLNVAEVLIRLKDREGIVLLDCVTLWLSNLLLTSTSFQEEANARESLEPSSLQTEQQILERVRETAAAALAIKPTVIFVTNEVGAGIVPDNSLARAYRDLAGRSNQILAQAAAQVYFVVAGYPMEVKGPGQQILKRLRGI